MSFCCAPNVFCSAELQDDDHFEHSPNFWHELFLLKPSIAQLRQTISAAAPDYLLHIQHQPHQLILQALGHLKTESAPADEHALDVSLL